MPDERAPGAAVLRRLVPLVCLAALGGAPVRADDLKALLQVQFQRQESPGLARELWVQTYQLDHDVKLAEQFDVVSQLQFIKSTTAGSPEQSVMPRGTFRLSHPEFGLLVSDRPISQTDVFGRRNDQQEQQVAAFLARSGLPRLDLTWTRRHQDPAVGYSQGTNVARTVRASQDLGIVNVHGDWGEQTQSTDQQGAPTGFLRNYGAGGRLGTTLFGKMGMQAQYEFSENLRGDDRGTAERTIGHSASINTGMRISKKADWNLSYNFRRTETRGSNPSIVNDNDGALTLGYYPTRAARLLAAGGVRTDRNGDQDQLVGYLLFSASVDGDVRPGWKGTAAASRSLNRSPGGHMFWVDSYRLASRWRLAPGLDAIGNLDASASGDTGAAESRNVAQVSGGISATPLRALTTEFSYRIYNVGASFTDVVSRSTASVWSIRWTPSPAANLYWSHNVTGSLPTAQPKLAADQLNVDLKPWGWMQVTVNRSTSDQSSSGGVTSILSGTQVQGVRVLAAFSSSLRASLGYNVANPGKANRNSALDVSVTKNFGR